MKDDDTLPTTTLSSKKESSDSGGVLGKGKYKFWALAAILLLAFWSMFTGTVSLRWSASLNSFSNEFNSPIHDDLDVLVRLTNFPSLFLLSALQIIYSHSKLFNNSVIVYDIIMDDVRVRLLCFRPFILFCVFILLSI